jgi:hypothetical protein
MRRPAFSSLTSLATTTAVATLDSGEDKKRIEFNSSIAPQPFLDPVGLEKVVLRFREKERQLEEGEEGGEEREQRGDTMAAMDLDAEYGSLAVRNRMRVHGRGVGFSRGEEGGRVRSRGGRRQRWRG